MCILLSLAPSLLRFYDWRDFEGHKISHGHGYEIPRVHLQPPALSRFSPLSGVTLQLLRDIDFSNLFNLKSNESSSFFCRENIA